MITITVETDGEQRLVQSPALFGGRVTERAVVQVQVVRDGQVLTTGSFSLGSGGGSGGTDGVRVRFDGAAGQALRDHHVVTFDGEGGAALSHPDGKCAGKPDCPVEVAFASITPAMRTSIGKWTCDAGPGGFFLLESIGT